MQTYRRILSILGAAAPLLLCGHGGAQAQAAPRLALAACSLPGVEGPVRCGTLEVPEDRANPAGRRIGLRVAVIPAEGAAPAPDPVFVLAGGPGQPATAIAAQVLPPLAGVRRDRDVVLVDQRGTGGSNPLTCGSGSWTQNARGSERDRERLRACRAELETRADLRMYGTPAAVADLDAVRAALGYERVNLVGISYGTRVAQEYLRRHPGRTRSVVMRAVAPVGFNIPLDGALAAQEALDRVVADCAADAACSAAYPRLRAELDSVFARADRAPAPVLVRDPASGDTATLELSRGLLAQTLYTLLLGSATRQSIPMLVHGTAVRGPQALEGVLSQVIPAVFGPIPRGMYLSVVCSEDAPRITAHDAAREGRTFMRETASIQESCAGWPRAALPADFHEPFRSDVPVLMVSGGADPATPPAMGERARSYLLGALHVVVPAASHGPVLPGCAQEMVARFVAAGSHAGLDAACAAGVRWKPFAVPAASAAAAPAPARHTEVPLVYDSGRVLVRVRVGAADSLVFILDTAGGGSVVSPETVARLGIPASAGNSVRVMGASGAVRLRQVPLPAVSLGGARVEGITAVVAETARFRRSAGPAYAGVLGNDFLRAFDVEVDVPAGRLRLWRRGADAAPRPGAAPASVANLSPMPGFVMFDVAVGDSTVRAILDSGASHSTLNWRAAAGAGVTRATPGMRVTRAAGGISGDTVESHLYTFDRVGVEQLRFPPLEMQISDLPVFAALGLGKRPTMLVGADLLRSCRVFISYSERRVHLCGAPAAA